jgi:xanthine dehydrogenase accessory factor
MGNIHTALYSGPLQSDWPLYGLIDDVRPALAHLFETRQRGALLTLVGSVGPSPRGLNAQMIIDETGQAAGFISGGCVEGSLAVLAKEVIDSNNAQSFVFGSESPFKDIVLMCGSQIKILIEPVGWDDETLAALLASTRDRQPYTRISLPDQFGTCYERTYLPTTRLMLFGGDPVALACATLAPTMGLDTILIRENGPTSLPLSLPITYLRQGLTTALDDLDMDGWSAVVTTTHDLDQDHFVLKKALPSQAFYVGALGSARNRAKREERLLADGVSAAQIQRLRAPVGLAIGATGPFEIAVSILADIIAFKKQKP